MNTDRLADAVAAFDTAQGVEEAGALADAFEAAGERIAATLEGAAKRGELSFNDMAETILKDLAQLALSEIVEGPLQSLVSGIGDAFGGGGGGRSPNIVMNVSGAADADSFRKSESQITASLARAARSGARRIG